MTNILSYIKTVWKAGREGGTAWTPERLNNIEGGIEQATNQINQNSQDIETINSNLNDLSSGFAIVDGTFPSAASTNVGYALPKGWDYSNTLVMAIIAKNTNNVWYQLDEAIAKPVYAGRVNYIGNASYHNHPFKVVLYKFK